MFFAFFRWWYGPGWVNALKATARWAQGVEHAFSIGILITTLFAPWRRIIALPGRSLDAKLRAMLDNLVSRVIGSLVRLFTLVAATIMMVFAVVFGIMMSLTWPLLPIAAVYCIVRGITG